MLNNATILTPDIVTDIANITTVNADITDSANTLLTYIDFQTLDALPDTQGSE